MGNYFTRACLRTYPVELLRPNKKAPTLQQGLFNFIENSLS